MAMEREKRESEKRHGLWWTLLVFEGRGGVLMALPRLDWSGRVLCDGSRLSHACFLPHTAELFRPARAQAPIPTEDAHCDRRLAGGFGGPFEVPCRQTVFARPRD